MKYVGEALIRVKMHFFTQIRQFLTTFKNFSFFTFSKKMKYVGEALIHAKRRGCKCIFYAN